MLASPQAAISKAMTTIVLLRICDLHVGGRGGQVVTSSLILLPSRDNNISPVV
jgi:hypothetical protein